MRPEAPGLWAIPRVVARAPDDTADGWGPQVLSQNPCRTSSAAMRAREAMSRVGKAVK